MCISANITHLRETRFATLNAYEEADEAQNSKHVVDTTMWLSHEHHDSGESLVMWIFIEISQMAGTLYKFS